MKHSQCTRGDNYEQDYAWRLYEIGKRGSREPFSQVMAVIETTAKTINDKLSRNGLIAESGDSGEKNVYGEDVQKLDAYANQVFTDSLLACPAVHGVGSEEMAEPKFSDHGVYNITHDPLDGSSNIDTNLRSVPYSAFTRHMTQ